MRYLKQIFFTLLMSVSLLAQTYTDSPYMQDYADKFELEENQSSQLTQVRSDRNNVINILSSDGLLQPWEKKIVKDMLYRPLTDMNILAIDRYEDQFVYLTDKAVLSNAFAGKFMLIMAWQIRLNSLLDTILLLWLLLKESWYYFKEENKLGINL